ncbi:MAG: hypothetical protein AAGE52_19240 [Myxococcota bacterium]
MALRTVLCFCLLAACGDDDLTLIPDAAPADSAVDAGVGPGDAAVDSAVDAGSERDSGAVDAGVDSGSDPSCSLSDDFEDPATLGCWTEENLEFADVEIADGSLQISFRAESPARNAWFGDDVGPALTQQVTGDFLVILEVDAHRVGAPDEAPTGEFNSAGLLVRDPASTRPGNQNWVMWNVGRQGDSNCGTGPRSVAVGSEGKTTVDSRSTLCLNPGTARGELALCRVGASVRLLRNLDGDDGWAEYHAYERADFPETVDVGVLANAWATPPDLHAEFRRIEFSVPDGLESCSAEALNAR